MSKKRPAVNLCEACKSAEAKKQCFNCGVFIPAAAVQCKECKAYQGWLKYFGRSDTVLALIVALISVLTPLLGAIVHFATRHSDTKIAFQGATIDEIRMSAMNTGRSPSLLRSYFLVSEDQDALRNANLELVAESPDAPPNVVPPNGSITLRLNVNGMATTLSPEELREKLNTLKMTVQVEIEESNGDKRTASDTFIALRIQQLIIKFTPPAKKKVQI